MQSSFKRKSTNQTKTPIGCKVSTLNSELLLSTGVSSLDDIIGGGGIPLHTTTLIKSDRFTGYSTLLLKYIASQSIPSQQPLIFINNEDEMVCDNLFTVVENGKEGSERDNEIENEDEEIMMVHLKPLSRVPGQLRQVLGGAPAAGCGHRLDPIRARYQRVAHDPEKWAPVFGQDHAQARVKPWLR